MLPATELRLSLFWPVAFYLGGWALPAFFLNPVKKENYLFDMPHIYC